MIALGSWALLAADAKTWHEHLSIISKSTSCQYSQPRTSELEFDDIPRTYDDGRGSISLFVLDP